ncbi:MAG: hypothetical protein JWQ30_1975 [Sediminibacterium sp.]|nr:hypothetical protein [Sediminibacterium sp.]
MATESIEAKPTKRLFIETLTVDLNAKAAILDLIDNSIDSYVRQKITEKRKIDLQISKDIFCLYDNCGGIEKEYLKEHVFRFGNIDLDHNNATIGMYGIGLKRAIFKIGKDITLTTDDGVNYCKIELKVTEWQALNDDWTIPFETEPTKLKDDEKPYTEIRITQLNTDISEKFGLVSFQNELKETIRTFYCLFVKNNIDFQFNGGDVEGYSLLVPLPDAQYSPQTYIEDHDGLMIEIICFIDPSNGNRQSSAVNERGWNLFCNKRLILQNDTSEVTGWRGGEALKDKSMLPKYHSIYNEFRGLVFLTSTDPFKLPLNTSKTSLNTEDKNYNYILNKMVLTARPIVDFLSSKYGDEKAKGDEIESQIAESVVPDTQPTMKEFSEVEVKPSEFKAPANVMFKVTPNMARISYQKDAVLAARIKTFLKVSTLKEVGEKTFDYFVTMEQLNNE